MSKIDEYRRALDHCIVQAEGRPIPQIREMWMTVHRGYQFLLDREERQRALAEELAASALSFL